MKKVIIISILVLAVTAGSIIVYLKYQGSGLKTIVLTNEGFSPSKLTIKIGDTVTFISKSGKSFWPASDPHPTHQIFSDFDSKKPIETNTPWIFTFSRAGTWKYHDHLNFTYSGTITVLDDLGRKVEGGCASNNNQPLCWETDIEETLKAEGLNAAFDKLASFYENEPGFSVNCHGYAHILGKAAYYEFHKNGSLPLSIKTSYCGYGFYHAFMETLLIESGNIQEARDFCTYAGKTLEGQTGKPTIACYHGIGHGAVDGSDPRTWGDPQAIINPGLQLCQKVGEGDFQIYLCASGVFNALAIAYNSGKYNLIDTSKDPYDICLQQTDHNFKEACYEEMNTRAWLMGGSDFAKASVFAQKVQETQYAVVALQNLASVAAGFFAERDYPNVISTCKSLRPELQEPCIIGIVGGLFETGKPNLEYQGAISFCESKAFNSNERDVCFKNTISTAKFLYPPEKADEVCQKVSEEYKKYCAL